ncbi:DUF432 domain-containing protein [Methanogenium cariaci]|uniref:DUF432 domain-containing protein n=1 Tax=Methanogenium cariaci TaxID=2197 RepID=UPI0007847DD6|nr:DUF432 domain-containing protein [Methanogenium cariaci]
MTGEEAVQKTLLTTASAVVAVNPIEPVNLPKKVTHYLEIEFTPVLIEPEGIKIIYLLFPIEIGVIVFGNKKMEAVDIFSFCPPQKYSLYGPSGGGVITKYYATDIYSAPPGIQSLLHRRAPPGNPE